MAIEDVRRAFEPFVRRCLHAYWRYSRGLTLGGRAVGVDGLRRVFLVRHSYVPGWHLPGGGGEPGGALLFALGRELARGGNPPLPGAPVRHAVFFHSRGS